MHVYLLAMDACQCMHTRLFHSISLSYDYGADMQTSSMGMVRRLINGLLRNLMKLYKDCIGERSAAGQGSMGLLSSHYSYRFTRSAAHFASAGQAIL